MDLTKYRKSAPEQKRTEDLMRIISDISPQGDNALDIGARDGHYSVLMKKFFKAVTALDLVKPSILHNNINYVQGDLTSLGFIDNSFDLVFCAEVLEHIPSHLLEKACFELSRISKKFLLIGVPYKQDLRIRRTTCKFCKKTNPPWGHVNSFNKNRLTGLFPLFKANEVSFVEKEHRCTNLLSAFFMNLAGNPHGAYGPEEVCINCGEKLEEPSERNFLQKIFSRAAIYLNKFQRIFYKSHPYWIHVLFIKKSSKTLE
jgi:hypothetical protein